MFDKARKNLGKLFLVVLGCILFIGFAKFKEYADIKKVVQRLEADTRVAEVLVTESRLNEETQKFITTIKFLEYDVDQKPLKARYFEFQGNQIQFQSLVVRFDDYFVAKGHKMKGKSIYLFLKAFVLDGANTQEFEITKTVGVPEGYLVDGVSKKMQREIWKNFWEYALKPERRDELGIKNVQLEAPGSVFVPGTLYTINIEHDGGLRIDTAPIPAILRGEKIQ